MHLVVSVVAQENGENKKAGQAREYNRDNRNPQMHSAALRIQCSIRARETYEQIELPDSEGDEHRHTNESPYHASHAFLNLTHSSYSLFLFSNPGLAKLASRSTRLRQRDSIQRVVGPNDLELV